MKTKIFLLLATAGLTAVSCQKTYMCKNEAGIVTCEVSASSQAEANRMCNQDGMGHQVAIKK